MTTLFFYHFILWYYVKYVRANAFAVWKMWNKLQINLRIQRITRIVGFKKNSRCTNFGLLIYKKATRMEMTLFMNILGPLKIKVDIQIVMSVLNEYVANILPEHFCSCEPDSFLIWHWQVRSTWKFFCVFENFTT